MEWSNKDQRDSKAVQNTRWMNIEYYENLENRAGVYIFANISHQVKYIGKAGAYRIVKEIASAISRDKDRGATLVKVLYTNSSSNAKSLERTLIDKYNPPNNLI